MSRARKPPTRYDTCGVCENSFPQASMVALGKLKLCPSCNSVASPLVEAGATVEAATEAAGREVSRKLALRLAARQGRIG